MTCWSSAFSISGVNCTMSTKVRWRDRKTQAINKSSSRSQIWEVAAMLQVGGESTGFQGPFDQEPIVAVLNLNSLGGQTSMILYPLAWKIQVDCWTLNLNAYLHPEIKNDQVSSIIIIHQTWHENLIRIKGEPQLTRNWHSKHKNDSQWKLEAEKWSKTMPTN